MAKYCIRCGSALDDGARFCCGCGAAVRGAADHAPVAVSSEDSDVAPTASNSSEGEDFAIAADPDDSKNAKGLLIGGGLAILVLLALYYWIFLRDDLRQPAPAEAPEKTAQAAAVAETAYFAVADANIRDKATTNGSTILGKLRRGSAATGVVVTGEDGTKPWLQLADGKGFIALSNLSETEPPKIVKALGDRIWIADKAMDVWAQPDPTAAIVNRIAAGTPLTLHGVTANDYVEIKLKQGGVGYVAEGARIADLASAKGKPIAVSFNPASCNFGGELEVEFGKLAAKARAAYQAIDKTDFPSAEARDTALVGFEGKSYFQRLERSFNGLSITGIAQHYESQSVYFADPPDKVLAVFRAAGYKIGRDGQFANTEIYAGIGATAGEGRSFGKTDLSCGV